MIHHGKNCAALSIVQDKGCYSDLWMVLPQFAHSPYLGVGFWVSTRGRAGSPVFVAALKG